MQAIIQEQESLIMREDVQFSIDLLNLIGDEPHWPSRYVKKDYVDAFPDKTLAEIAYHLNCCVQAGLLDGKVVIPPTIGAPINDFGLFITGLSHKGNEYLANIQTPSVRERAIAMLQEKSLAITTENLTDVYREAVRYILGIG